MAYSVLTLPGIIVPCGGAALIEGSGLDSVSSPGGRLVCPNPAHPRAQEKSRTIAQALCAFSRATFLSAVVAVVSVQGFARQQPQRESEDKTGSQLLGEFTQKSASELAIQYLERPPYPLFVIRRLIDLGDPIVIPALRHAFTSETEALTRQFLAAALVRLGDTDPEYFGHVAAAATKAVASDLPYSGASRNGSESTAPQIPEEIRSWAQAHGVTISPAIRLATIEFSTAVEALGETADGRSLPILLRGLDSPNFFVVRAAAFGLARLHTALAVKPIIKACKRLNPGLRPMVAKSLLYFDNKEAQRAAGVLIGDPDRTRRWRAEVIRKGWTSALRDPVLSGFVNP